MKLQAQQYSKIQRVKPIGNHRLYPPFCILWTTLP